VIPQILEIPAETFLAKADYISTQRRKGRAKARLTQLQSSPQCVLYFRYAELARQLRPFSGTFSGEAEKADSMAEGAGFEPAVPFRVHILRGPGMLHARGKEWRMH
jgi:hypothetical protein